MLKSFLFISFKLPIIILVILSSFISINSNGAVITSTQSGNWTSGSTWVGGVAPTSSDDAVIALGHTVSASSPTINNLTVNNGGVIILGNNSDFTVTGNLIINGSITGGGGSHANLVLSGTSKTIDGLGSIDVKTAWVITNAHTILSTASITVATQITVSAATTVTNNGTITTVTGGTNADIVGSNATTSIWTNAANSTLISSGTILSTGVLNASATGNNVNYFLSGAQTIKAPSVSYYHLVLEGSGTKTLAATTSVGGDLTIYSGSTLAVSTFDLSITGNWTNSGTFTMGTQKVTFTGTSNSTITNASGQTFYQMTVSKTSGASVILANNVTVNNTLTMTSGNINAQTNKITLGTSTASIGTLSYTAGAVIGQFERYVSTVGTVYLLPVGTPSYYRPANITFQNLSGANSAGSIIAEFKTASPGRTGLNLTDGSSTVYNTFVEGYWALTTANSLKCNNFDLQLTGNGFTSFTVATGTRLLARTSSSGSWTDDGTHAAADATNKIAKRTAMTILSGEYAFGDLTPCTGPSTSSITGTAAVCQSATGISYSVTNTSGSTYAWTITGGTQASGTNTNSITVDWGATGMVGNVSVVETNSCTQGSTINFPVNIHSLAPSSITGSTNVPQNSTGYTYSVTATTGYTYTWSVSSNGTIGSGQNSNSITVNWGAANAASTVSVTATKTSCGTASSAISLTVNVYVVINSIATGNFNTASTWDCACTPTSLSNVRIKNGHTVTVSSNSLSANNVVIDLGGTLTESRAFSIGGDLTLNGTLAGSVATTMTGTGATLDGQGSMTSTGAFTISGTGISSSSTAVIDNTGGSIALASGITFTNNGSISVTGSITGGNASSTWVNASNSTLKIGGTLLSTGTLTSTASGNTVEYNGISAQSVKANNYYNLTLSGTRTTTNLTLPTSTVGISGTLTNSTSFTSGSIVTTSNTIDFNGSSAQTIPAFTFNNITISGSGTKTLGGNIIVGGNFTNSGTFDPSTYSTTFSSTGAQTITGTTNFYDLTISGARTTNSFTLPTATLGISHTLTSSATFTTGSIVTTGNTIDFNGSSAQTIPVFAFNNITISNTGTKTLGGNINVKGNFTNSGTFANGNYTITFNGNTAQTVTGSTDFYNLTLNNSSGLTITSGAGNSEKIYGVLTLTSGTLTTNGNLIIASNASNTGQIAGTGSGSTSGNVTVERYMPTTGFHYISSPLNGPTYNDINDDVTIGPTNFYEYVEAWTGPDYIGWQPITSTGSTPLTSMKGYGLQFPSAGMTLDMTGTYSHGTTASISGLTFAASTPANSNYDGWTLLGNPYPSYIDWTQVSRPAGIGAAITYYNKVTDTYGVYIPSPESSVNNGTQFIPSMQAVWIQTTANNQTLTIPNSARTTNPVLTVGSSITSYWRKSNIDVNSLKLKVSSDKYSDETVIRFFDGATPLYDQEFDALKMANDAPNPNISSNCLGNRFAINSLPDTLMSKRISLNFEPGFFGNYTISANMNDFTQDVNAILFDSLLNKYQDLREDANYNFNSADGSSSNRFYIDFKPSLITSIDKSINEQTFISSHENYIDIKFLNSKINTADICVYDLLGQEIFKKEKADISSGQYFFPLKNADAGIYIVKVTKAGTVISGKVYIQK